MPYQQIVPIIDSRVRSLCRRPYPGHPLGCPNWNKKDICPPQAPMLGTLIDLDHPVYAIWNEFDLAAQVDRMRERHPEWSWRQLVNCLYWQQTARNSLRAETHRFLRTIIGPWRIVQTPEACGVNMTETMQSLGVRLQWPPRTVTLQIVLAGKPQNSPVEDLFGG